MIVVSALVWWALWRDDFDGMRTEYSIKKRERLDFEEFYAQFYAKSGLPKATVSRILDITAEQFGLPAGCIRPSDNLLQTDLADTIYYVVEIAEEFGFPQPTHVELLDLDGSFDCLLYTSPSPRD